MSYDWGPRYLVPSETLENFSGTVRLRETYDEDLLRKELAALKLSGHIVGITNPWYFGKKNTNTWIKIGESDDRFENFPVSWDTRRLENGQYQVLGLMHVFVKKDDMVKAIARENIVEVMVKN